ncbi:MAG TPA: SDR family NAD(P)-dependent oxidoreductase [Syntrophobacteraceae bacterium]|nr:SDR family NAD(P)-dependent oxidoreductase [Syntrophobacteraceae bacterium]
MSAEPENPWKEWLLEVVWQLQPLAEPVREPWVPRPSLTEIHDLLLPEAAILMAQPGIAAYEQTLAKLEKAGIAYVLKALEGAGWKFNSGKRFSTIEMALQVGVVDPYHRLLERLLEMLSEEGILQRLDGAWEVVSEPEPGDPEAYMLGLSCPGAEAEIALLERCGPELARVLQGRSYPLELLFPEGDTALLAGFYEHSPVPEMMNGLAQRAVLSILDRLPRDHCRRILEIGAGTGSTTARLLPHLPDDRTEYVFTDVSHLFLNGARKRFQEHPFVSYRLLDIERDPQSQGFEPGRFDLVLASNVLHATRDLRESLQHVRQLLASGGVLMLLETTGAVRWLDLVFGLTEGWWRFSDHDLRPSSPHLSAGQWKTLLDSHGFEDTVSISPDDPPKYGLIPAGRNLLPESLILARKTAGLEEVHRPERWLVLADAQGIGRELRDRFHSRKDDCVLVFRGGEYEALSQQEYRIDPAEPEHFRRLFHAVQGELDGVVHLWSLDVPLLSAATAPHLDDTGHTLDRALLLGCAATLSLIQAMTDAYIGPPSLWLVTRGAQPAGRECTVPGLFQSPLWGMGKVIPLEHPDLSCVRIDLDPEGAEPVDHLFRELNRKEAREDQVAFRNGQRYVARLSLHNAVIGSSPCSEPASGSRIPLTFSADGSYMVTGGLGGLGLLTARRLVERGARNVILVGRNPPGPEAAGRITEMERRGARVTVIKADISDAKQVAEILDDIEAALPPLRGIIHAAGLLDDGILVNLTWERFSRVMAPKVNGAWALHALTASRNVSLDFFVLFSSAAAMLGNAGQANHAAANAFLDALAHHRRAQGLAGLSINWGAWSETGIVAGDQRAAKAMKNAGLGGITSREGLIILEQLMACSPAQIGVSPMDWPRFIKRFQLQGTAFFDHFPDPGGKSPQRQTQ